MTHRKGAIWTERLVLALILASLGGTLNLVLAIHRRVNRTLAVSKKLDAPRSDPPQAPPSIQITQQAPPPPSPPKKPGPPPVQPKPPEDPTVAVLARFEKSIAREAEAARVADRRAAALEAAQRKSVAESQRWKRREMLVREQVAALNQKADKLERDAVTLDAERDVLARERDALKAALVNDSQRSGYAVLPYKGPNGTWRRPIVLECVDNTVKLQPRGQAFSMLELSPLIHPRSSPLVLAIAREMLHIQRAETPDGAPAVPYLVFMVRPDGIRPYYQARARLESLGIAFGYELIEQDLAVDIPDFDDVRTWDGTRPIDLPELAGGGAPNRRNGPAWPAVGTDDPRESYTGPSGNRVATSDASRSNSWPPSRNLAGPPGSDRRWPDLARGDGLAERGDGARGAAGAAAGGASQPEIDLGGGKPGVRAQPGDADGSGDGSPDAFVWPTNTGGALAAGGAGPDRGIGGGGWSDSARSSGRAGAGSPGPDSAGSIGTAFERGAGSDRGLSGSAAPPRSGTPWSGAGERGSAWTGDGPFAPGRAGVSRPMTGSSPDGVRRGASNTGGPAGIGSGPGNADVLPTLEPAAGSAATPDGPGGSRSGGSGSRPSGSNGLARNGAGGSGRPPLATTGESGAGPGPVAAHGAGAVTDPGFARFRPVDPAGNETVADATSASGGRRPAAALAGATTAPAPSGSDPAAGPGQATGFDGDPSVPPGSGGSAGTTLPAENASGSGSMSGTWPPASGTASGSRTPVASSRSGSSRPAAAAPSGDPGGLPVPLESVLARVLSPNSLAGGVGSGSSNAVDSSSTNPSDTFGGSSSDSIASINGTSGGQPPLSTAAGSAGLSLPSSSLTRDADSEPDGLKDFALPPIDTNRKPGSITVPFEIVVVCRRGDVLLHPGGYQITAGKLGESASNASGGEGLFQRQLRTMVRRRAQADPLIRPRPRLRFLVETGGATTFWTARRQLVLSNLDWPMTVQVAGPQTGYLLDERLLK